MVTYCSPEVKLSHKLYLPYVSRAPVLQHCTFLIIHKHPVIASHTGKYCTVWFAVKWHKVWLAAVSPLSVHIGYLPYTHVTLVDSVSIHIIQKVNIYKLYHRLKAHMVKKTIHTNNSLPKNIQGNKGSQILDVYVTELWPGSVTISIIIFVEWSSRLINFKVRFPSKAMKVVRPMLQNSSLALVLLVVLAHWL